MEVSVPVPFYPITTTTFFKLHLVCKTPISNLCLNELLLNEAKKTYFEKQDLLLGFFEKKKKGGGGEAYEALEGREEASSS